MTTLVDINDFREYVKIPKNLTIEDLTIHINLAQEKYLKPILCYETFTDLINAYENDDATADETALMTEVIKAIVFRTYEIWLRDSNIVVVKTGLKEAADLEGTSENLSEVRLGKVIEEARQNAKLFENRLINFLEINKTTYTTWAESECYCVQQKSFNTIQGISGKKQIEKKKVTFSDKRHEQGYRE